MPSSTTAHVSHTSTSTSSPHPAAAPALLPNNVARARVHTYTAHALVLFNIYGIPLSSGIWLEYYFISLHPTTPLLALSAIFAAQCACLGLAVCISAYVHARSPHHWRWMTAIAALLVCGAHIGLLINTHDRLWVLVLCQGALTGLGLGTLCAVSTRMLSMHYRHSVAIASRLCISTGFAGAGVYTVVAWCYLRTDRVGLAYGMTLLLFGVTLLPAVLLMEPSSPKLMDCPLERQQQPPPRKGWRTTPTLLALSLILPSTLIPPLYLPLLLAHRPNPYRADAGVYTLLTLYITALLTSALVPRIPPSRVSARTLCGAASILTGITLIPLIWTLRLEMAVSCAVVYGAGLGGVCTLWLQVVKDCGSGVAKGRAGALSAFALVLGLCAAGAVVGGAAVLQGFEAGGAMTVGAVAGGSVVGGLGLGVGGGERRGRK
ncbi:hypothetical protein E8E11_008510 [Didymella keratinophila]|nr:hypothetical protein E8E11_008510 [Didymella keratinophila]